MTALFIIQIRRALLTGQDPFTAKTVRILLAHIDAYETKVAEQAKRIEELESEMRFMDGVILGLNNGDPTA